MASVNKNQKILLRNIFILKSKIKITNQPYQIDKATERELNRRRQREVLEELRATGSTLIYL